MRFGRRPVSLDDPLDQCHFGVADAQRRHRLDEQIGAGVLLERPERQGLAEIADRGEIIAVRHLEQSPEAGEDDEAATLRAERAQGVEHCKRRLAAGVGRNEQVGLVEQQQPWPALHGLAQRRYDIRQNSRLGQSGSARQDGGDAFRAHHTIVDGKVAALAHAPLDRLEQARLAELARAEDDVVGGVAVEDVGRARGRGRRTRFRAERPR